MKKGIFKIRLFCLFIALVLIFLCLPVGAFEGENGVTPIEVFDDTIFEDEVIYEESDDDIIINVAEPTEIVARRDRNVKHYLMPNGKMQAIVHGRAIHRQDENGVWQDIDNGLYNTEDDTLDKISTKDNRVTFAKKYVSDQPLLILNENGYSISISHVDNNISANKLASEVRKGELIGKDAIIQNTSLEVAAIDNTTQLYSSSSIKYGINDDVEIEYILHGDDIKENIIIHAPQSEYIYEFKLELDGLCAELHNDGYVNILDSEKLERLYIIPAPFMFDSVGAYSNDVYYTLVQEENEYTLAIIADNEWVNSEDRVFPITIDPSIEFDFTKDLYIDSENQNTNYGNSAELIVGRTQMAFFDFYYDWPDDFEYDSVSFNVAYYFHNHINFGSLEVGLYSILQPWDEDYWTWANASSYPGNAIASAIQIDSQTIYGTSGAYKSSPKWVSFDITDLASYWQKGLMPCYGVALKWETGPNGSVIFNSSEGLSDYVPYYIIEYSQAVSDGVYKIKNVANGLYLDTTDGGYTDGTLMQQWSGTSTDNNLNQLFKITHLGVNLQTGKQVYSIRPMTNSGLGLYAKYRIGEESTQARVKTITTLENKDLISTFQRWNIEFVGNKYVFSNDAVDTTTYLATLLNNSANGSAVSMRETTETNREWILEEYTGNPINEVIITSYPSSMEIYDVATIEAHMYSSIIGVNGPLKFRVVDADHSATDKATITLESGRLIAMLPGTIKLHISYMYDTAYADININNMLIYRTRNRERYGFEDDESVTPIIYEDLTYGSKTEYTMINNGSLVSMSDLYNGWDTKKTVSERVTILKNFLLAKVTDETEFQGILSEMVDHFVGGSGTDYSNIELTNEVKNHINTQSYINGILDILNTYLSENEANINNLYYDEGLWVLPDQRENHPFVSRMRNNDATSALPSYGSSDHSTGLLLAIHGWHGNKIEIESFNKYNNTYDGIIRFTFYDHFGLDTSDLSSINNCFFKYPLGTIPGFRQWYILQHWDNLGGDIQPKPFVTIVSFTVYFSGHF